MINPLVGLRPVAPISLPSQIGEAAKPTESFGSVFANAVEQVSSLQDQASHKVERFLSGEGEELHQVALSTQKAELAFELFQQVRNKMVQSYQEVMKMQL